MSEDWPAAHSMDTVWWGVDGRGRVALFATGEGGAAPASESPLPDVDLITLVADAGLPVDCEDRFDTPDGRLWRQPWSFETGPAQEVTRETPYHTDPYLLWVRSEEAAATILATEAGQAACRMSAGDKIVLWVPPLPLPMEVFDWQERGLLYRGWKYHGRLELWRVGVFDYSGSFFGNSTCMPFLRTSNPKAPLTMSVLPSLALLDPFPLPRADFELDTLLQLYEHMEARSSSEDWVGTTGDLHEGQAPEGSPEQMPVMPASAPTSAPTAAFLSLLAGYLAGDTAAQAVLGDWLTEQGQPLLPLPATASARLDHVLMRFFSGPERALLEARFVEHLAEQTGSRSEEVSDVVRAVLQHEEPKSLEQLSGRAFRACFPLNLQGPPDRVAWAAWALGSQFALVPARTARAVHPFELSFQIECVLEALSRPR